MKYKVIDLKWEIPKDIDIDNHMDCVMNELEYFWCNPIMLEAIQLSGNNNPPATCTITLFEQAFEYRQAMIRLINDQRGTNITESMEWI